MLNIKEMNRWIKVYYSIKSHWLWEHPVKMKWWLDMLFIAEYKQKEINIHNKVYIIERGQLIASYSFLRERWAYINDKGHKCTPSPLTIGNFLKLLVVEEMISIDKKVLPNRTSLITIINYDRYQYTGTLTKTEFKTNQNERSCQNTASSEKRETSAQVTEVSLFGDTPRRIKNYENFDFSIVDDSYLDILITWLDYKRSRGEKYKNQKSFEAIYKKMLKIGSPQEVRMAVEDSIANNYAGLFKVKNNGTYQQKKEDERNRRQESAAALIKGIIDKRS